MYIQLHYLTFVIKKFSVWAVTYMLRAVALTLTTLKVQEVYVFWYKILAPLFFVKLHNICSIQVFASPSLSSF
jgi:hypothetical protein